MGKTKRLKKLMEAEAGLLHQKFDKLALELAEVKRQAAKNLHPTTMTPEVRNWSHVVDAEYQAAADEAVARAKENKSRRKRVVFRRVRSDLFPAEFDVNRHQATQLALFGVGYSIRPLHEQTVHSEFLLQFTPFITTANVSDLTSRVNRILGKSGSVYAEVQILD